MIGSRACVRRWSLIVAVLTGACATSQATLDEIRAAHKNHMELAWKEYQRNDYTGARADWDGAIRDLTGRDREAYLDGRFYLAHADALSRIAWTHLLEDHPLQAKPVYEDIVRVVQSSQIEHQRLLQSRHDKQQMAVWGSTLLLALGAGAYSASKGQPLSSEQFQNMVYTPDLSQVSGPRYLTEDGFEGDGIRMPVTATLGRFLFVGRLRSDDGSSCTGGLVGWRIVLTAAHCVTDDGGRVKTRERVFIIDNVVNRRERDVAEVHVAPGYRGPRDWSRDWALLVLDGHPYKGGGWLGVMSGANARRAIESDDKALAVAGYSSDINHGSFLTLDWGCSSIQISGGQLDHRCTYWKGASGAPILLTRGTNAGYVVGIVAGSVQGQHKGVAATTDDVLPKLRELINRFPSQF